MVNRFLITLSVLVFLSGCASTGNKSAAVDCIEKGIAYARAGEFNLALMEYDMAIEMDSGNADVYNARGNIFFMNGEYDTAIKEYRKRCVNQALHCWRSIEFLKKI